MTLHDIMHFVHFYRQLYFTLRYFYSLLNPEYSCVV